MLTDAELSQQIAKEAGALLLALRESYGVIEPGDAERATALRKEGDRTSHEFLAAALAEHRPDDALLSEEGVDDEVRLSASRVWIVDPLDGTWEYGQSRADFAVHVALWHPEGRQLTACTVDLPAQGLTRTSSDASASPAPLPTDRAIRLVASRTRPPATLHRVTEELARRLADANINTHGVEILDVGSVGAKVNELLSGRAEIYMHDTGFYEWDVAAPYGVAEHYGYDASHVNRSAVAFNQMPPYVRDLVVSHPALTDHLHASITLASA